MMTHIPMDHGILHKWLTAGYLERNVLHPTEAGTPQGGICSPVIANMALDGLEARLRTAFPRSVWNGQRRVCPKVNLIRFADDFIVTGATKELLEEHVKPLVEAFLRERGLELSPENTQCRLPLVRKYRARTQRAPLVGWRRLAQRHSAWKIA